MNSILTELWQDRDIKFDSPAQYLELRRGEFVIEKLLQVEDTKVSRVECAQQKQNTSARERIGRRFRLCDAMWTLR